MIVNEEKHTTPRQRIVIVAIALFLLVSTGILYVSIVLGSSSSSSTSAKQARYEELLSEYQSKVNAQATELSKQYFDSFVGYKSEVKAFNAADVTVLTTTDLKVGTGAASSDLLCLHDLGYPEFRKHRQVHLGSGHVHRIRHDGHNVYHASDGCSAGLC